MESTKVPTTHPAVVDPFDVYRPAYLAAETPQNVCWGQWHPDGLHLWGDTDEETWLPADLNIVVTNWSSDDTYQLSVYTDDQMDELAEWVCTFDVHPTRLVEAINHLCDQIAISPEEYGSRGPAWLLSQLEMTDAFVAPGATRPLPAPAPTAPQLAARYEAMVRANGPTFVEAVAGLATGRYDANNVRNADIGCHIHSVAWEIAEMAGHDGLVGDHFEDPSLDVVDFDTYVLAADIVVHTFRNEIRRNWK